MKLLALHVCRIENNNAIFMATKTDISSFSYLERKPVRELANFLAREIGPRTQVGDQEIISHGKYRFVTLRWSDGLSVSAFTDENYPPRVAFRLLSLVHDDFREKVPRQVWQNATTDNSAGYKDELNRWIQEYKNPLEFDSVSQVMNKVEETKKILNKNIKDVLGNREKIEHLLEQSEDVSLQSEMMFKAAKKFLFVTHWSDQHNFNTQTDMTRHSDTIALLSGGKDSIFSLHFALYLGFKPIAVAHIRSPDATGECDSFMYQTVGSQFIETIAKCLDLPLVTYTLQGTPTLTNSIQYSPENSGDEVEDLYHLLLRVKTQFPTARYVSTGAILSDYQRCRVENVCQRLDLISLAPLWKLQQSVLLKLMVKVSDFDAVVIKIASMGLDVNDLGMSLRELASKFLHHEKQFGFHSCGEGGEYETITLNAPLYNSEFIVRGLHNVNVNPQDFTPIHVVVPFVLQCYLPSSHNGITLVNAESEKDYCVLRESLYAGFTVNTKPTWIKKMHSDNIVCPVAYVYPELPIVTQSKNPMDPNDTGNTRMNGTSQNSLQSILDTRFSNHQFYLCDILGTHHINEFFSTALQGASHFIFTKHVDTFLHNSPLTYLETTPTTLRLTQDDSENKPTRLPFFPICKEQYTIDLTTTQHVTVQSHPGPTSLSFWRSCLSLHHDYPDSFLVADTNLVTNWILSTVPHTGEVPLDNWCELFFALRSLRNLLHDRHSDLKYVKFLDVCFTTKFVDMKSDDLCKVLSLIWKRNITDCSPYNRGIENRIRHREAFLWTHDVDKWDTLSVDPPSLDNDHASLEAEPCFVHVWKTEQLFNKGNVAIRAIASIPQ